jgi:hypothetical protein
VERVNGGEPRGGERITFDNLRPRHPDGGFGPSRATATSVFA